MPFHFLRLYHTATRGTFTAQGGIDNGGSTAYTGPYLQGFGRAVFDASSALHTGVTILNTNFTVVLNEYGVRANFHAGPATVTLLGVEAQGNNIFQIDESSHLSIILTQ